MASGNFPKESNSLSLENLSLVDRYSFDSPSSNGSSTATTTPPFSGSIWAGHSPSNRGVSAGDSWVNLQSMPGNMYMTGYDANLQEESMIANSSSRAASMPIWANQENPFEYSYNLATPSLGGRGYMLTDSNGLNLHNGIASYNSFAIHQESLSSAEISGINAVLALEDNDIILLSKDQSGSIYLQKLLSWKDSRINSKILGVVYRYPFNLMTDQYGHHLFARLIESCSENQLGQITTKITSQEELFFKASINKFGSISIKRLIKVLAGLPLISLVISALHRRFKDTMVNGRGSSVVIHCLETLSDQQNELLYVAAINLFRDLATNIVGCISLNNFINDMRGPHRGQLLDLISSHAAFLSKDPSGNFVVQHVLGLGNPVLNEKICSSLRGKYVELSSLRYGSHVVEKCLKAPGMAHFVVEDFLKSSSQLLQLAKHKYGNYVLQTALKITKSQNISLHKRLLKELQDHHDLQFGFGKKLYNLIAAGVPADWNVA